MFFAHLTNNQKELYKNIEHTNKGTGFLNNTEPIPVSKSHESAKISLDNFHVFPKRKEKKIVKSLNLELYPVF